MGAEAQHRRGRITQHSVDAVLQRSDLVDVAGAYTQLHKRGAEFSGRCPFHDERTPSFWINQTKGVYHCFGCGASGDVISFVRAKQGLDFVEAVEVLADRFRVELEYEDGGANAGARKNRRRLFELMDAAATFYEAALWNAASAAHVRAYLRDRHIADDTARAFRLGWSPQHSVLADKAKAKGFTDAELTDTGLVTAKGSDFFRERLMVPIVDRAQRVLGFGARKLRDEQFGGKYVNSRDGVLFHKKRTVFLPPGITTAARDAGHVIVVEGYMDVIALWQAGFRSACAVMGTALTDEQVVELKRLAPRALFAFDPDAAGRMATVRALEQARQHDLDVRVVLLPVGEDPADVIQGADGRARMSELLDGGVSLLHYRTSTLLGSGDLNDATERERIYRDAVTMLGRVPDGPVRREQIKRVENALRFDTAEADEFHRLLGTDRALRMTRPDSREPRFRDEREVARRVRSTAPRSTAVTREKRLLALAVRHAERGTAPAVSELMPDEAAFTVEVHRRARTILVNDGPAALATSRIRDDADLLRLVAELATLVERDFIAMSDDDVAANVAELARAVELQYVDRLAGELRARATGVDPTDDDLRAWSELRRRRAELDPRTRD